MCTVIILRRSGHKWPVLIAANRDEMDSRPWDPPARHWPDRENVVAGIDRSGGGSWMGINDEGIVACVLNGRDSLGPDKTLRSRGEIVLEALDHADATDAAEALSKLNGRSYRSFNLVVADNRDAYWLCSLGNKEDGRIEIAEVPEGLSMLTAFDLNDHASGRVEYFLPRFKAAVEPDVDTGDWSAWMRLLASTEYGANTDSRDAMRIETDFGFRTLSSTLVALPSVNFKDHKPVWLFTDGAPGDASFKPVKI
ncbi:MAG: NRDE family protein [Pseudomonadota bacterium]|nr:NRDE family protein [Pseudomonadota bacterium]